MSLEKLIQIISEIARVPQEEIGKDSMLFEDLGLDSLDMYKIYVEVSGQLDAVYDKNSLLSAATVGALYERILNLR